MVFHRHIQIDTPDGMHRVVRGVEANCPEDILEDLDGGRWKLGFDLSVWDTELNGWSMVPHGKALPLPPIKILLSRNSESLQLREQHKHIVGGAGQKFNYIAGAGGDEDIYAILGNDRHEDSQTKVRVGKNSNIFYGEQSQVLPDWMRKIPHPSLEVESTYKALFPQQYEESGSPRLYKGMLAEPPSRSLLSSKDEQYSHRLLAGKPNERDSKDLEPIGYNPSCFNKRSRTPRRNHYTDGFGRKERGGPLPIGGNPAHHNSPACGGDNTGQMAVRDNRHRHQY